MSYMERAHRAMQSIGSVAKPGEEGTIEWAESILKNQFDVPVTHSTFDRDHYFIKSELEDGAICDESGIAPEEDDEKFEDYKGNDDYAHGWYLWKETTEDEFVALESSIECIPDASIKQAKTVDELYDLIKKYADVTDRYYLVDDVLFITKEKLRQCLESEIDSTERLLYELWDHASYK